MRALLHKVGSAHTDINIRIVFTIMTIKECQYLLEHDQGLSGLDERAKAAALVIVLSVTASRWVTIPKNEAAWVAMTTSQAGYAMAVLRMTGRNVVMTVVVKKDIDQEAVRSLAAGCLGVD